MTPYPLTLRAVALAALQAHAEGRLGYQRGHEDCLYRYPDGAVCAIGAAVPDDVVAGCNSGISVQSLREKRRISVPDADMSVLKAIQDAHDDLCDPDRGGDGVFLALLRKHAGDMK